jgi:hypothetical protein
MILCRFFCTAAFAAALLPAASLAQTPEEHPAAPFTPVISGPNDIAVGRTLVLDASASIGVDETAEYRWYREGVTQPISRTLEAVFTPEQSGTVIIRLEVTMDVDGESISLETLHEVVVFDRKVVLIADTNVAPDKLLVHQQEAENSGVYLRIVRPPESTIPIVDDSLLTRVIKESNGALAGAETIVIWSDGIAGLQALQRALEGDEERLTEIQRQTIVLITERSINILARTARGPFSVLEPNRIVITRKEALNPLLTAENVDQFLDRLSQWDFDFVIVDESTAGVRPWNLLSSLVNYMLTHGVSTQTIILLLTLPLIATLIAFMKQVIGVTTFGLYTPSVIALSFLALGWPVGIAFLLFILITGYVTRSLLRGRRLLHIPKVAIVLTVVSLTLLLLLGLGAFFGLTLAGDTIFILLIMSTLSETFLNVKSEEGLWSAILGIAETVFAALVCVFIVQWSPLQSFILAYPETILITLLVNILLGKWTGLRLVEYFRFREVFRHLQEE